MEIGFAANCRHAHAIAIAANASHHALDQMLHLGMIGRAEAQGVHIRDRPRTHGEDIAQDTANTGRCTLIGLDIGRMVVALHLEDRRLTIADINYTSVFAGAANDPRGLCRQFLQVEARALVRTMFGPHDRKNAEFDQVRLTAERLENLLIFFRGEAVLLDNFGGDRIGCLGHSGAFSADGLPPLVPVPVYDADLSPPNMQERWQWRKMQAR